MLDAPPGTTHHDPAFAVVRHRTTQRLLRSLSLLLAALVILPLLSACGETESTSPPIKVVATIPPLADWARQVGQQRVSVTHLVPTGVDPQTYTLSASDRQTIAEADVLIFNGLELEPWLNRAVLELNPQKLIILDLSQFINVGANRRTITRPPVSNDERGSTSRSRDLVFVPPLIQSPYLWLNPGPDLSQRAVTLIADTFTRVEPDRLLYYRRNAERYNGELENLDNWIKRQIRNWPRTRVGSRNLITVQVTDRAWHHFATRYNINLRLIDVTQGTNPPLSTTLPFFVDQFMSPLEQLRYLEVRQPDAVLNPLGEDNYIELIRTNVMTMTKGVRRVARTQVERPNHADDLP